ncbi:integral membrane protein [Nannizzia gypsea CBS 118893]|uniref:Integral membrane protein n=1 Tax=Arthroderma gypseum (strain ATCC MYA-4604 / CBS 118893) TaxID=535722 RepID=E5R1P6_ARTGP|nr:integral membrane protein [Nannizzia gypsea CBS 118893]EFQ97744.1 integral membrane protein [Nannizzia gypsea CBS 118893]
MLMSGPEYVGTTVMVLAWLLFAVSVGIVGTRYYVRWKIVARFTIDDGLILIALALALGNSIFLSISTHYGLGTHMTELSKEQIMYTVKWVFLCEFFSIMSPCVSRIAYASLLLSILPPMKWRSKVLWALIWIQFVVDVVCVVISFSQCQPLNKFWDRSVPGNCWSPVVQQNIGFFQGSVCSLVDLVLAIFPASIFWNLNMELKKKISLSLLMGLGVIAMIASIIKTIQLQAITATADITYAMAHLATWWTLEAYLVIIATSIPTLKPIVSRKRDGSSKKSNISESHQAHSKQFERTDDSKLLERSYGSRHSTPSNGDVYVMEEGLKSGGYSSEEIEGIKKETTIGVKYETATHNDQRASMGVGFE